MFFERISVKAICSLILLLVALEMASQRWRVRSVHSTSAGWRPMMPAIPELGIGMELVGVAVCGLNFEGGELGSAGGRGR